MRGKKFGYLLALANSLLEHYIEGRFGQNIAISEGCPISMELTVHQTFAASLADCEYTELGEEDSLEIMHTILNPEKGVL